MPTFDHLTLQVSDWIRSRDWYVRHLGMKVEFEVPERQTAALQDEEGFTIFVEQSDGPIGSRGTALYFRVEDIDATHGVLCADAVLIHHGPQQVFWGHGVEVIDPDGYTVRLWDERSMKGHGDA